MDGQKSTTAQLSSLIREFAGGGGSRLLAGAQRRPAHGASSRDWRPRCCARGLYLGAGERRSGAWSDNPRSAHRGHPYRSDRSPRLEERSAADAAASLVAVALERTRALQQGPWAEAQRNTEQLRTAVLDGLAHGFKTPLTAIQTASSGIILGREISRRLELDVGRRTVKKGGVEIRLTPTEFDLLAYLMAHAGHPVLHPKLLSSVWGSEYSDEREYLRTFILQLRRALGDNPSTPVYLRTVST